MIPFLLHVFCLLKLEITVHIQCDLLIRPPAVLKSPVIRDSRVISFPISFNFFYFLSHYIPLFQPVLETF